MATSLNLEMVWKDLERASATSNLGNISMLAYALCKAIKDHNPGLHVAYEAQWNRAGSQDPDLTVCSKGELPQVLFMGLVCPMSDARGGLDQTATFFSQLSCRPQVAVPFNEDGGHGIASRQLPVATQCEFGLVAVVARPMAETIHSKLVLQLPPAVQSRFHCVCLVHAADRLGGAEFRYFPPGQLA